MKEYEFDAVILKHGEQDACYIEFPYDVPTEFGVKGQVKIKAAFDGVEYRGSLANMGGGCHILGIRKEIRQAIGKQAGDIVHVWLCQDTEPRILDIPDDFKILLDENPESRAFYNSLSYSNQKRYVTWITSAKKAETRNERLTNAISLLKDNVKQP